MATILSAERQPTRLGGNMATETLLVAGLVFLGYTLLIYSASRLGAPPNWDELYHILAARSWLAEGEPRIANV